MVSGVPSFFHFKQKTAWSLSFKHFKMLSSIIFKHSIRPTRMDLVESPNENFPICLASEFMKFLKSEQNVKHN